MADFLDRDDALEHDKVLDHGEEILLAAENAERVQEICSLLIANGYLHKEEVRDLMYDDALRTHVEQRLDSVGMRLVHNSYSDFWGVALNERTAADDRLEWSNNFGLERGAMALLLILWCKLILPKRMAQEERQPEDGSVAALFPEVEKMPKPRVNVSRDQILAEFGDLLGGVSMTSRYIAQLARARLIKAHGGVIEEGPLLSLVVDEARLSDELRREVLLSLLKRERSTQTSTEQPDTEPPEAKQTDEDEPENEPDLDAEEPEETDH